MPAEIVASDGSVSSELVPVEPTPEEEQEYAALLADGWSDHEAREAVWPAALITPAYFEVELAIREAWSGDLRRGSGFPGVLPDLLRVLAAKPLPAKPFAADAVRAAAVQLGIHP